MPVAECRPSPHVYTSPWSLSAAEWKPPSTSFDTCLGRSALTSAVVAACDSSIGSPTSVSSFAASPSMRFSSTGASRCRVSSAAASASPSRPLPLKPHV